MAELKVTSTDVVVRLTALETVAACRREIRVPVGCLRMVRVEESPLSGLSLLRLPGISWPGAFVLGSRRNAGLREFVAVRAGVPAVVMDAEGALWDRVVISHPDAVEIGSEIAALLLGRGPGNHGHGGHGNGDQERRRRSRRNGRSGLTLQRAGVGPAQAPVSGVSGRRSR